jgi:hypothetical protein
MHSASHYSTRWILYGFTSSCMVIDPNSPLRTSLSADDSFTTNSTELMAPQVLLM